MAKMTHDEFVAKMRGLLQESKKQKPVDDDIQRMLQAKLDELFGSFDEDDD